MTRRHLAALLAFALLGALPARAGSLPPEPNGCPAAIQAAEGAKRLPPGLLGSIAMVESGRADPRTGRFAPWPWTINVAGSGFYFPTKADAIAAVEAARARGVSSIDVGCMQVNLQHHPKAFATLDEAFEPGVNAAYAADFLARLRQQSGSWPEAAASYHSATPGLREDYQRRVLAGWPGAARYGGALAAAPKAPDRPDQYTPAFRAQLAENAANRARWVAMGIVSAARPTQLGSRSGIRTGQAAAVRGRTRMASLRPGGLRADLADD